MNARKFYNRTAEVYDLRHSSPDTLLIRRKELSLIKKFAKGRVLDFGCGTGYHLSHMDDVIGLDISEEMLKKAKKKGRPLILSEEQLPLKDSSLETIFCLLTVINMTDYKKLVNEFSRVLKPGGRIIVSTSSIYDESPPRREKSMRIYKHKLKINLFEKEEIMKLFHGFKLLKFDSLFTLHKPRWGNWDPHPIKEKVKIKAEAIYSKQEGSMYFFVFEKPTTNREGK
jgi:ubiquinone/menaquinone biosynthesis C-methylase UbiE